LEAVFHLDLLMSFSTTAEEWFRIEILGVLSTINGISVSGTNQQTQAGKDRPDFTLDINGETVLIELKVLPKDRNYPYGWQRFQAGANNKKDFENVVYGVRRGVIYVYWNDLADWKVCRNNLIETYQVNCLKEDCIPCCNGQAVVSYWEANRR
jgi:hypothetical protein